MFTYFLCFLELFIEKFTPNINNEHVYCYYSCPTATFAFCSHGEKLSWYGRLPGVVQWVTHLSKLSRGQIHVNSYRRQTMHLGKVNPRVSELISHREILTSKLTFIQGVSEKLLKNREHKSPLVHTFIWCFSIVSIGNQQCSVPHF